MTSNRVSAVAAVAAAWAALVIPAILDFQQRESLAKSTTIEYFHRVFDSRDGRALEDIATEGEIFYSERWNARRAQYAELPEDEDKRREFRTAEFRKIDKAWRENLFEKHGGEHGLRKLAVFLLHQADVVYECARFREYFKDTTSGGHEFRWGAIKRDDSRRLVRPGKTYFGIIGDFVRGFVTTKETVDICHRDSLIHLFGRWFSSPFWYLRTFLYCDEFLRQYFFMEKYSDGSPVYRLESVAMVIEQIDLEFRYPHNWPVVMRTEYEVASLPEDIEAYGFRYNYPAACV